MVMPANIVIDIVTGAVVILAIVLYYYEHQRDKKIREEEERQSLENARLREEAYQKAKKESPLLCALVDGVFTVITAHIPQSKSHK